jgi:polysaccharide pyruvyl transferase WcaK-like protein
MKYLSFAVGMRVHFLIFAALQNIPFVSLPYASKVKGLLEDLDIPYLPLEKWNTGKLCAAIDLAWDTKKELKKALKLKMPTLVEHARKSMRIVWEFLTEKNTMKEEQCRS